MIKVGNMPNTRYDGRYTWTVENFGPPAEPGEPTKRWKYVLGRYFFCHEADATLFLLRWGGKILKHD